jgi:hypothetical protein
VSHAVSVILRNLYPYRQFQMCSGLQAAFVGRVVRILMTSYAVVFVTHIRVLYVITSSGETKKKLGIV